MYATPFHAEASGGKVAQGLGEGDMLLHLDAGMERLRRIVLEDGHALLDDDRAGIRARVDEMDSHSRDLAAVV